MYLVQHQRFVIVALLLLLGSSAVTQLNAQVLKGQILGTITDPSGAVIPGASITLSETNTNAVRESGTNESGLYVFTNLDPGLYQVAVSSEGFSIVVRGNLDLLPNSTVRVNIELAPGAVTETVTVTGALPLLQTDRADTGVKIESRQLKLRRSAEREQRPAPVPIRTDAVILVQQSYRPINGTAICRAAIHEIHTRSVQS